MQYIQLQGQIANDLELPLNGSYNIFMDTSDNCIKVKDDVGNLLSGLIPLNEVTRDSLTTMVESGSLTTGAFYKITNVASRSFYDAREWGYNGWSGGGGNEIQDGGTTIILQATSDKTLSKSGVGLFYVPKYATTNDPNTNFKTWDNTHRMYIYNVTGRFELGGNYSLYSSNTENSTTVYLEGSLSGTTDGYVTFRLDGNDTFLQNSNNLTGLELSGQGPIGYFDGFDYTSSYAIGDKVIYGGRVWQNISGSIGYKYGGWPNSELTLNPGDWSVIPFDEIHYNLVSNNIEYEFEKDNISYRSDGINEVYSDWKWWDDVWGYNQIKFFPWGHTNVERVSISNSYLNAFVNFPYDSQAWNIKFDDGGGFNAHTWGRYSYFKNIHGDKGAHFTGNDFGRGTYIYDIKLGMDAYMNSIYTYDNNNRANEQIYSVTLGNNSSFQYAGMYYGSYIERIEVGTHASMGSFSMYENSVIRRINLGVNTSLESFTLGQYSSLQSIDLGSYAYINNLESGKYTYFENLNLNTRAYIYNVYLGYDSNLSSVEISSNSSLYNVYGSEFTSSAVQNISIGPQSSINGIDLGSNGGLYSLTLGNDAYLGSITLEENSYISDMNLIGSTETGGITVHSGSYIRNFQLDINSGIGGLTVTSSAALDKFSLGPGEYISSQTFSSSLSDVTLSKGFKNLFNTQLQDINGSNGSTNGRPNVSFDNRSIVRFDISGVRDRQAYALPDGGYEGQEITFIVDSDGTHTITPVDIEVWSTNIKMAGYGYNLQSVNGAIKPFARLNVNDGGSTYIWKNVSKAVWTNGKWYSDAELYND